MPYKLSSVLRGHELDVRAVFPGVFPEGSILSASRDRTTRVWVTEDGGRTYSEGHAFAGHKNFISSVCAMAPTENYPHGLIATGGHDNVILVWTLDSVEPIYSLTGHTDTVCSLVAGKFGTLLSGSWDKTAKVWLGPKCVMTLEGHDAAVWAVLLMPDHGLMLTGSADKTIKLWKAGSCQSTFTGHTDCVRGLAVISPVEFISCSNDCTIRRWMTTGECLQVYAGHENFIYSIAALSGGGFASVGEDRTLRVWKGDSSPQVITLPATSIWAVTCLSNGDIVTGASDGVLRVFSCQEERFASPEEIKIFEDEVASQTIPAQASGQIGDIKMDQLPGPEALLRPGKRSGQTIMVRRGQTVECHQWNDIEGKWDKIGEVVGAPGSEGTAASSSNKTMYKGKEYDYVFSVEIQEGKPPLKLPYNVTDDPWVAAHNFLEANDLSQMFLDQVVSFIQKNTANVTIGPPGSACDPFTGSSRYVPGSTPSHSSLSNQPSNTGGGAVDPFTGGGSYRPSYGSAGPPIVSANIGGAADPFTGGSSYRPAGQPPTGNPFFPKMDFVTFGNANTSGIWGKISEINEKLNTEEKLVQEEMQHLNDILLVAADPARASTQSLSEKQLLALNRARQWPADSLFPVLDIVRLVVRHQSLAANVSGPDLVEQLLMISGRDGLTANVLLSFRIFANLFSSADGKAVILQYREKIIERLMSWLDCANKNVHISICTVFLNFSVAYRKEPDFESQMTCLSELGTILNCKIDNEALFRALVAVGNIVYGNKEAVECAEKLATSDAIKSLTGVSDPAKVGECATRVLEVLSR